MQKALHTMLQAASRDMRDLGDQTVNAENRKRREGAGHTERFTRVEMDMASVPQLLRLHLLSCVCGISSWQLSV